jgi:hypothetical protein
MLTILLVTANSRNAALDLEYEHRLIVKAVREGGDESITVEALPAATFQDLEEALAKKSYDIVHFSGHGGEYGGLYFRDDEGNDTAVSPAQLAGLLKVRNDIRCVVLNACFSLRGGYLINMNVPFTIASEDELSDPVAFAFSAGFYLELASGKDIPAAYIEAVSSCISQDFYVTRLPILLRQGHPENLAIQGLLIALSDGNVYYPNEIDSEGCCTCERGRCVGAANKMYCFWPRHLSAWVRKKRLFAECYDEVVVCPRCGLNHKRGHIGRKSFCNVPFTNQRSQCD